MSRVPVRGDEVPEYWGPATRDWWVDCKHCHCPINWFNIEVMDGVRLWGWLHRSEMVGKVCTGKASTLMLGDTRGTESDEKASDGEGEN